MTMKIVVVTRLLLPTNVEKEKSSFAIPMDQSIYIPIRIPAAPMSNR